MIPPFYSIDVDYFVFLSTLDSPQIPRGGFPPPGTSPSPALPSPALPAKPSRAMPRQAKPSPACQVNPKQY